MPHQNIAHFAHHFKAQNRFGNPGFSAKEMSQSAEDKSGTQKSFPPPNDDRTPKSNSSSSERQTATDTDKSRDVALRQETALRWHNSLCKAS